MIGANATKHKKELDYFLASIYGGYVDKMRLFAAEGSMLTFLGLLHYDLSSDTVSISDPLAFIGGGKTQCLEFMQD
jgi:hypothetical protein